MITNSDRSKWFGASDTHFITGNYDTQTFLSWWLVKIGIIKNNFKNKYTETGSYYEHKIAKLVEEVYEEKLVLDRQVKLRRLRLRVNLDANTKTAIHEIKTTNKPFKKLPNNYWQQVQVQMFGTKIHKGFVDAYEVTEEYYENFFIPLEKDRLTQFEVNYDKEWINTIYLPRLKYLVYCYKKGINPTNDGFNRSKYEKSNDTK